MMKRAGMVVAAAAAAVLAAGQARAENFDDVASKAKPVAGLYGLGAALWTQVGGCKKMTNDLERRQCEGIRDARTSQVRGKTFLFRTGPSPVAVGKWDDKKKSVALEIAPCLACEAPVDVDGEMLYVVGEGALKVSGGAIEVAPIHKTARAFKDKAEFDAWQTDALPRLRSEFVVRVDGAKKWNRGGSEGMQVDVVAYRTYDPCTGVVVGARPASDKLAPDQRACGDKVEEKKHPEPPKEEIKKPKEPELPLRLSPFQINQAMTPVRKQANQCFDAYGVAGKASFNITINSDGTIGKVEQTGDFVDTPTGKCIEKAIGEVTFPKFRKTSIAFDFPVQLQ